jgi:hypothetical protein
MGVPIRCLTPWKIYSGHQRSADNPQLQQEALGSFLYSIHLCLLQPIAAHCPSIGKSSLPANLLCDASVANAFAQLTGLRLLEVIR